MTGKELFETFLSELSAAGAANKSLMVMIAGPNGAGKTTLWRYVISQMLEGALDAIYINADEIERELNEAVQAQPDAPQTVETAVLAQAEATRRRDLLLSVPPNAQSHFVYETVFSDPYGHKLAELQRGVNAGYYVVMLFVGVNDLEQAQERVQHRVSEGGHDVPAVVQSERFPRVFANARKALDIAQLACFFDNSKDIAEETGTHRPVAIVKNGAILAQHDHLPGWWQKILPEA